MILEPGRYRATPFQKGKAEYLEEEGEILLIGYGNGVGRAVETADRLKASGLNAAVMDLRFVKPIDKERLEEAAGRWNEWYVFSDGAKMGGVASAIAEALMPDTLEKVKITSFEYEDRFIPHGNTTLVEESLGLRPEQIAENILKRRSNR